MNNLSFHITDITSNSIRAQATQVSILICEQTDHINIRIEDNGCGMDDETINRVKNPFYTTRITRKVGLGLPFLIQNAEQTGGDVIIESTVGKGTVVRASFISNHIDCPPWGNLGETIALLITGNPDVTITFSYQSDKIRFSISSQDIKNTLEGIPISHPKVISWLREMLEENLN